MISKRYKALPQETRMLKHDKIENLLKIIKKNCTAKFNESVDVHFRLNLKQKKSQTNIRTVLNLPVAKDKKVRVAVICEEEKLGEAKKSGADVIGSDDLINNISAGKINFEKLVSTPKMMIKLGKLGKILGPKGLMPNPKLGTVTNDIIKSVKDIKSGQLEIKNDKDGNISLSIGNKNISDDNLIKNFNAVLDVISKEKPSGAKGNFIKSAFVTSTMGISYKLKLNKGI
jgi:large subunit ribosomal protein L1